MLNIEHFVARGDDHTAVEGTFPQLMTENIKLLGYINGLVFNVNSMCTQIKRIKLQSGKHNVNARYRTMIVMSCTYMELPQKFL